MRMRGLDPRVPIAISVNLVLIVGLACSGQIGRITTPSTPTASTDTSDSAVTVYDQNGARVVNITSLALVRTSAGTGTQPRGAGSGFVLDGEGRIVTNNHVIEDANQLKVTLKDRSSMPARLVGRDPENDLAVLQVNQTNGLQPVTLGDSDSVRVGEMALAIGSPLGLQQTMTRGIVSALRMPGEEPSGVPFDPLGGAVQTDASINSGNSGGPLFNAAGEVIGVNTFILSQSGGSVGLGFAIPINVVKRVVAELIQTGHYRHPELGVGGVSLSNIGPQTREQLGVPTSQDQGVLVSQVSGGAQAAGIQAGMGPAPPGSPEIAGGGDIVTAIDGRAIGTTGELRGYVENAKHPGDTVTLGVLRNGRRLDVPVTLGERPPST
jgi:S1-C subfamily serine protease